MRAMC